MSELTIRRGRPEDLPEIVDICNRYVESGHVTFDTELVSLASRRTWFDSYGYRAHQLLVTEQDDHILGYATSSPYRQHPAFDQTVELGIYLDESCKRRGIGTKLYSELLSILEGHAVHLAVAGIALPNDASIALHRKLGFREVGVFHEYAVKGDVRISSVWFERRIR